MIKFKKIAFLAMTTLVLAACGGGGSDAAPEIDAAPHIKASVAGTVLKADSNLSGANYDRNGRALFTIAGKSAGSPMAAWSFSGIPHQTGTFVCGTGAGADIEMMLEDRRSAPALSYFADGGDGSSCSVTVTAVSADEVSGTFDATMMEVEGDGSTSVQVKNGSFRVQLNGLA